MFLRARALAFRPHSIPRASRLPANRRSIVTEGPYPTYFQPPLPTPPYRRSRWTYFRIAIYAIVPFALTYGYIAAVPKLIGWAAEKVKPGTEADLAMRQKFIAGLETLPLVQNLRDEGGWQEWDAYNGISVQERKRRLTSGPLAGCQGVGRQRVFWNDKKHAAITVVQFGHAVTGWPGVVHGGCLATIMDESLGRVALRSFSAGTGVTANLTLDYRARVMAGQVYFLTATVVPDRSNDRKATIIGRLEDAKGGVCVEATGIFVVPKALQLAKITGQF